MSKYARTKSGNDTLYYLPEFEVLYTSGKPTLIYKPNQIVIGPVAPEEINETLAHFNDEDNWIAVDRKHYKQIKDLYGSEQSENKLDFIKQLAQQTRAFANSEEEKRKHVTFEAFYNQLAAMPNKKIN